MDCDYVCHDLDTVKWPYTYTNIKTFSHTGLWLETCIIVSWPRHNDMTLYL